MSAASVKSRAVVVPNERSSVSWQVMSQCQASRCPPYSSEWPVHPLPAGSRPVLHSSLERSPMSNNGALGYYSSPYSLFNPSIVHLTPV